MSPAWIQAIVAALALVVTLVLSGYVQGQRKVRIHEKRLETYQTLWPIVRVPAAATAFDLAARRAKADEFTEWYYKKAGGLLLPPSTFGMFLVVRDGLRETPTAFATRMGLGQDVGDDDQRRFLARQFSLLRTQLKSDCSVYYGGQVSPGQLYAPWDLSFLDVCRARLDTKAAASPPRLRRLRERLHVGDPSARVWAKARRNANTDLAMEHWSTYLKAIEG
jgi:hypothetical protein